MTPALSIVIVSYNTRELTLQTLKTLTESAKAADLAVELIVVDNASTDDSVTAMKQAFPTVKVFASAKNLGFGGGNNFGAKQASGEILGFFNSDIIANDSSLAPLVDYLKRHPDCGIVAPKLFLADGVTSQPAAFGPEPTLTRLIWRAQQRQDTDAKRQEPFDVDWVTGAAFCLPRELFFEVGGFDEKIFMYYEDVDLCRRVRDKGFRVTWLPASTLIHIGGQSNTVRWERKKQYYRAQYYYTKKYYGAFRANLLWALRLPFVLKAKFSER